MAGLDTTIASGPWSLQAQTLWSATDHPTGEYEAGDAGIVGLGYFTRHIGSYTTVEKISGGFRAESGFLPRVGHVTVSTDEFYRWETGRKSGLVAWRLGILGFSEDSTINDDALRGATARIRLEFSDTSWWLFGTRSGERFGGTDFDETRYRFEAYGAAKRMSWNVALGAGDEVSYFQPVDPYLGRSSTADVSVSLAPLDRWTVRVGYGRKAFVTGEIGDAVGQIVLRNGKTRVFDASVANVSSQFFFTQALSARVTTQYDDVSGKAAYTTLLAWRPRPGTVAYLGYQDSRPTKSGVDVSLDRGVFLKLSYGVQL